MAYLVVLLSFYVTLVACQNSYSRANQHIGFMGTRGKRSTNEPTTEDSKITLNNKNPKSISKNIEFNENDYIHHFSYSPDLSIIKRAPIGFMGMRGKKDSEYSEFSGRLTNEDYVLTPKGRRIPLSAFNRFIINSNQNPKRAPSGFMGMRGKKLENFIDNKRVPLGFYGTRGKKDLYEIDEYDNDLKNFDSIPSNLEYENELNSVGNDENDEIIKRGSNVGFYGVRGKKLYEYDEDDAIEKRAPTGFLGMRGKKYTSLSNDLLSELEKRKLNGFFGVRGKKDVSAQLEEEKRSPFAQFFGIRGKKQPLHSGFFGMRGKKEPFHFRGKFVGVRGKKSSTSDGILNCLNESTSNSDSLVDSSSLSLQISPKRDLNDVVGMREKKLCNSDESKSTN